MKKEEKLQYFKFLNNLWNLSIDSEYSLHHEFSTTVSAEDCAHVTQIYAYINECMNLFSSADDKNIIKIATGVIIEEK